MKGGATIADTFEWCRTCGLHNIGKPVSNYGGECCSMKKKRKPGKLCDYWIRQPEEWDKLEKINNWYERVIPKSLTG
jgi:hypothetical protein